MQSCTLIHRNYNFDADNVFLILAMVWNLNYVFSDILKIFNITMYLTQCKSIHTIA